MKAWKALGDLTCGKPVAGELGAALTVIRPNVVQAVSGLCHHRRSRNRDHKILCALYGRSLLDLTCAAIIGRMDPFRLAVLRQVQSAADFELGARSEAAIQWSGDVLMRGNGPTPLFSQGYRFDRFDRALLGDVRSILNWIPAFSACIDFLSRLGGAKTSDWLSDLVGWEPSSLVPRMRGVLGRHFSLFSKVIHAELLLPPEETVDQSTLDAAIIEAIRSCATISFISHFDSSAAASLTYRHTLQCFIACEEGLA